ncbi:MAG TPA: T9SS type A sorting domain-containing protein [Candidatus Paceibacterota bacterium]|nr:T9SS type A sorting domain-containing protein [Candidatus Paceibacterota bacterium]
MKKIALLIFFALFAQKGISQVWDSIGSGLPAPSGVRGIWKMDERLFASTSETNTNLYEYTPQSGWTQIISSSQFGQIWDVVYDSTNNQAILLGKFEELSSPVNSNICNSLAKFDLATGLVLPIGSGFSFPDEYTYRGRMINGVLYVAGRFNEINGLDTINNFTKVDLQTESYLKVCGGNLGDLVRDFCVYNNDTILIGSFVRNGIEYPVARITPTGFDFGPYRGFGYSLSVFNSTLYFAGNIRDTLQNLFIVGSYDGNVFSTVTKTNNIVRKLGVFKDELYIAGSFDSITNSSGVILPVNNLAKYDGLSVSEVSGGCGGAASLVWSLTSSDDTLYIAGNFTQVGSVQALNVARLITPISSTIFEQNPSSQGFVIYPNPTDGNFQIDIGENFESKILVQIFDISGRKVGEFTTDLPTNLSVDLPNGVYFIKIKENTTKLVIRK